MDRRTFVATAAVGVFGLPLAVTAQRKLNNARIGVLLQTNPEVTKQLMMAFTKRLAELGWLEGKSIEYLVRYAHGNPTQYSTLIGERLAQKPDVIYAPFGPFALAVKKHTCDGPIVFSIVDDPVRLGLVASLARPGGNATGVTTRSRELTGKQLRPRHRALQEAPYRARAGERRARRFYGIVTRTDLLEAIAGELRDLP